MENWQTVFRRSIPKLYEMAIWLPLFQLQAHVFPLFMQDFCSLIEKNKDAEFIFTEVNSDYLKRIDHQFLLLEKEGIIQDYRVTSQSFVEGKEGDEVYFKFNYQGKPVQLTFALNRSGEKFWRKEYSQRANLVIFDDADEDKIPEFVEELREQKRVDPTTRSKVILVEGRNTISVSESVGKLHYTPPSSLRYEEIKGQYGHCTGHYGLVGRNGKVWNIENNSCHHKSGVLISIF